MEEFSAQRVLETLIADAGDEGTRSYLLQIEKKLNSVLTEAELLAGAKEMRIEDFATLLADGLEATEIAPNPLRLDAVFVGDLTDSRIERVRVLFALGMTDAVPRASDDANLITDRDKIKLQAIQAYLEPMVEEVNLRNRESLSLNLCTFTDGLHLSYALGSNGEDPALSDVFRYVRASFIKSDMQEIEGEKVIPERDFAYRCSALSPAARLLLVQKHEYEQRKTRSKKEYSSIYEVMSERNCLPHGVDLDVKETPYKEVQKGEELFLSNGALSPSLLETYFDCPYKCFAQSGLSLQERKEGAVLAVDTGNFIHKLLELVTKEIQKCPDVESFACLAREQGKRLMTDERLLPKEDTLSGVYSTEKLLEEGVEVAKAVYQQINDSALKNVSTEVRVNTPNVRGKIDRVDENDSFVRVIDYKTGTINAEVKSYYAGLKLQMELYMSAIKGNKTPVGVFYFPASVSFSDTEEGKFRMQGFLNGDVEALQSSDTTLSGTRKSEYFDAALEKNRSGSVMDGETFTDFLDYALYVSKEATEELRKGYISPSPIKKSRFKSCDRCKFGGMCGFHEERVECRTIPSVTSAKIAEIVKKCKEEEK